jgi:apolipoprotein N-acyltransferase
MTGSPSISKRLFHCFLSAFLVCLSFPNFLDKSLAPWGAPLIWIALVPFFLALRDTRPKTGAFLGLIFGFLHLGGILYWIAMLQEAQYLKGLAWFILVFYLSLYFMLFGWIYCLLKDRVKILVPLLAPVVWVALEYIRGTRPLGGFPWGQIGYAAAPYPQLLYLTSWTGIYGLTFLMIWVNVALTLGLESLKGDPPRLSKRFIVLPVLAVVLVWLLGSFETKGELKTLGSVALLQPSVDQSVKWDKTYEEETYDILGGLTRKIKPGEPLLAVWPETAAPSFLLSDAPVLEKVAHLVKGANTPTLVGCLDGAEASGDPSLYYNAAIHFDAEGKPGGIYRKVHLVPFGEFVPWQKYLSFLGPVIRNLGELGRGKDHVALKGNGFTYSPMICYEVIFPEETRAALRGGVDALVNISNDAWYGDTASPYQHAMMAVVRAAENRKPLLRSSNSGICLVTDPFGKITASTKLFDRTLLTGELSLFRGGETLYAKWGSWFPRLCLILALLAGITAFRKRIEVGP